MGLHTLTMAAFLLCTEMLIPQLLTADETDASTRITQLAEKKLEKAELKHEGFATPQKTAQTLMWSLRERDAKCLRSCFTAPEKMEPVDFNHESLKDVAENADRFQVLAIRTVDDLTVDLKFRVDGWGDKPLSHRLKRIGNIWKFDSDSSTSEPSW